VTDVPKIQHRGSVFAVNESSVKEDLRNVRCFAA
jgi:hypothetical protein